VSLPEDTPIVLYDGVCGLCNRLVQFILKRDVNNRFRFASLQSEFAEKLLKRHGADSRDLDTFYLVISRGKPSERVLMRSDAILAVANTLGGVWKLAGVGALVPRVLRDGMYRIVARNRYRVFGKHESCMLPSAEHRAKFLDL
jgi:predicted DCC family thiol-disulfide oxidoreductase YuxK